MSSMENIHERKLHASKSETCIHHSSESNGLQSNDINDHSNEKHYKLVSSPSLPSFLADNEYLLHRHRSHIPSFQACVRSLCGLHTETVNIWTHLIGSACMVVLMLYFLLLPTVTWSQKFWFLPFFLGSIVCMGLSATFHSFNCYSAKAHSVLAKLDYCGIIVLIVASFPPWLNYGFYCQTTAKISYLILIGVFGVICIVAVMSDKFATPEYRKIRAALFMALGLTGLFPGFHYFYSVGVWHSLNYGSWLVIMALWYLFGGFMYAIRVPERLKPGSFDIWFQSHQILHIAVIIGVICCYIGITRLAEHRLTGDIPCPH